MLCTENLSRHFKAFSDSARHSLLIISPYIRQDALRVIMQDVAVQVSVITTWSTPDIICGASDLSIYPYLRSRGADLLLLPRLHMKAIVRDLEAAIISTANITKPGLGISIPGNIECAVHVDSLPYCDCLWIQGLLEESILVRDDLYSALASHVDIQRGHDRLDCIEEFDLTSFLNQRKSYLSSLPLSQTPERLLASVEALQRGDMRIQGNEELTCVLHDMALLSLAFGTSKAENRQRLQANFFSNPLVSAFEDFIQTRRFFGEVKAWVQMHCADLPQPRRKDLTTVVRVLFNWMQALGEGKYMLSRPHYSECIIRTQRAF